MKTTERFLYRLHVYAPGIVALTLAPLLVALIGIEINEPLFGDQAVYQYMGWCIRHGMKLFQDIGMPDGPFIHYLNAAIQSVFGITERALRTGDLFLQVLGGFAMGALLAPRASTVRMRWLNQTVWGAFGCACWITVYFNNDWHITCQRETFYALFGSAGIVCVYSANKYSPRTEKLLILVGSYIAASQMFGKPTGIVYTIGNLLIIATSESTIAIRERLKVVAIGIAACVATIAVLLTFWGSFRGYLFWCFMIPLRGNKYLFGKPMDVAFLTWWEPVRSTAMVCLIGGIGAIRARVIPKKALAFALAPLVQFTSACLQGRGFPYQIWPATIATHLFFYLVLVSTWENAFSHVPFTGVLFRNRGSYRRFYAVIAVGLLTVATYDRFEDYRNSPFHWKGDASAWSHAEHSFGDQEKLVGDYIKNHTNPSDRAFVYVSGENSHIILMRAERRSASPFIHSFWLDPIGMLPQSIIQPDPKAYAALKRIQQEIRDVACGAVESNPPEVMAFNLLPQVYRVCPRVEHLLAERYLPMTTIGNFTVYHRRDGTPPATPQAPTM